MKQPTTKSSQATRCAHLTASGRQCRLIAAGPSDNLCFHHRALQQAKQPVDLSRQLLSQSQGFQTAQGVNFALTNIYELLAADRISTRRAAVLAYINSLLLRTLPAIDADAVAGIADPTLPEKAVGKDPSAGTVAQPATVSSSENQPTPVSTVSPTHVQTAHASTVFPIESQPAAAPAVPASSEWDPSIPDPDPIRKPS